MSSVYRADDVTPTRLTWLRHLALNGETGWDKMPRRHGSFDQRLASITNRTWRPMVEIGWIEAKFYAPNFRTQIDWQFKITDAGRAILAQAQS